MEKHVKFTRDCLALGEHCETGSIKSLPEKTCAELVNEGAATYFTPPQKAKIETATMPTESNEKAVVKTGKRK